MDYQNKTILHINHILRIAEIILKLNNFLSSVIFMNDSQVIRLYTCKTRNNIFFRYM